MKSKIFQIFFVAATLAGVTACDNYDPKGTEPGTGRLNTASLNVEVNNAEKIITSNAGSSRAAVDISNYIVTVTDAEGAVVNKWTYSQMPELPVFTEGTYTVKVESAETPVNASWEAPYFMGSRSFRIQANQVTDVDVVTCVLSNIRVTVKFTDALVKASAGDLKVTVRSEGSQNLTFSPSETRSGYFAAVDGLVTLSVNFTGTVSNVEEKFTKVLTGVEAGQHRIVTFGLKENGNEPPVSTGVIEANGEGINVSTDVVDEDLTVDVPAGEEVLPDDDRPGQEGGGDTPTPPDEDAIVFTSPLDLSQVYDVDDFIAQGLTASIEVSAPAGIKSFMVKIESDNLDLSAVGLPQEFDLVSVDGETKESLGGLGFPTGDQVKDKTQIGFDITTFVGMLGSFQGKSYFYLTVTDNAGNTNSTAFKFNQK